MAWIESGATTPRAGLSYWSGAIQTGVDRADRLSGLMAPMQRICHRTLSARLGQSKII